MDYLYCREGLLVTNGEGDPIILKEGDTVTLQDVRGNRLFAHKWENNDEIKEYQQHFTVEDIMDNALVLQCSDYHFVIATNTELEEPCVVECDGKTYLNDRILTVAFPGEGYINAASFKITPCSLPPKRKDNCAPAA